MPQPKRHYRTAARNLTRDGTLTGDGGRKTLIVLIAVAMIGVTSTAIAGGGGGGGGKGGSGGGHFVHGIHGQFVHGQFGRGLFRHHFQRNQFFYVFGDDWGWDWSPYGEYGYDNTAAVASPHAASPRFPADVTGAHTYYNRGIADQNKGDYDGAIADFNQAIALDPKIVVAYNSRGIAYKAKGDLDNAIADFDQAIAINPKYMAPYFSRGRLNLFIGALPKALADLNEASELSPKNAYAALWLDIANKRSNLPSRLPEAMQQIDMTKWPAPVIRLYLGQLTPEAVLAAAVDHDSETQKVQVCEANFYAGELVLHRGDKDGATRLFRLAAAGCPKSFIEYDGAVAEIKALGLQP
jgi:lipoprotein NlpI